MAQVKGTISNWGIVWMPKFSDDPIAGAFVVVGEFKGGFIRTSPIVRLDLRERTVETWNSLYELLSSNQEAAQAAFDARYKD